MRHLIFASFMALGVGIAGVSALPAAPLWTDARQADSAGETVLKVQYAGYCAQLQRACLYKEERGEVGRGNCHRYQVECGHQRHCEELRKACVYKRERGEVGQGNCRRYHHECGA